MFIYQQTHRYFAQIAESLEELGAEELAKLNAQNISPAYRGIFFDADRETLYRVNYMSRLITRVLAPIATFQCHSTDYLYRKAKEIPWEAFFTIEHSFAVFANTSNSKIRHSQYAALRLKDAIVDHFRKDSGKRPDVKRVGSDVSINLHIENNRATVSLDTSGESLHRRGYRRETVEAPMQETVAAAMIRLTGWDGSKPLYDPMCGSGTLISEALMHYCRIPAGIFRKQFGFEFLPDYDATIWKRVKETADQRIRGLPEGLISGSDVSVEAVAAARTNNRCLPNGESISLKAMDFRDIEELTHRVIVCNPPYGIRLDKQRDLHGFYRTLGDFLKQRCAGSCAYIYFGNRELIKHIGLKPSWKRPLMNGGLDGRLVRYDMY